MNLQSFLEKINSVPEAIEFEDTISIIDDNYYYSPGSFNNGPLSNEPGVNEGSCKIFAFAKLQGLSDTQTLHCFGRYYREDVIQNPNGTDHMNIRQFMISGLDNVSFSINLLTPKDN